MKEKNYTYYRAGVAIAKLKMEDGRVSCMARNMTTMEYEGPTSFHPLMAPFSQDLDKRIEDAIAWIQGPAHIPEGYEKRQDISGKIGDATVNAELYVQKYGNNPLDIVILNGEVVACLDNERNYLGILVRDGYESLTPQKDYADSTLSQPASGIAFAGTFMVPMRDGVRLATDVYLPANRTPGQKFPTVLIRTCYNKSTANQFFVFAHYGYAVVSQDTRGREASEGIWQPIINEKPDGNDTLDWIAAQEWSDGSVGMIGASYLAITQWAAAANGNPHLKALISMVTGGVPMFDFPHRAGVLSPGAMAWTVSMRNRSFAPDDMERQDWDAVLKTRPIRDIPYKGIGERIPFWDEWMEHEQYDGYWHQANWLMDQHKIDVPALYVTGWYDDVGPGSMQMWDMNKRNGRSYQKMILGAWKHKMNISRDIHEIYYGVDAIRYDMFYQYLRWYDRFLKGIANGIDLEPKVDYFTIGAGKWQTAETWPPENTEHTALYFGGEQANTRKGRGTLSFACPQENGTDQYDFDPNDPTPFLIDISENECLVPANYKSVELRSDVLVYTSEPLEQKLTITGEPMAILYAASTARDTDWVVRITDVDENGNSIRMCDGIVRAKYRKSFIEPKLLLPGEIVRYEIPLTWISNCFNVGHRIRIEVASGADSSIFPNSNTGELMADCVHTVIAHQTIYHGPKYPSCVVIPIVKALSQK